MARSITASDFDFVYSLYMHPQVNPWLLYEPMDTTAFKPVFEDLLSKNIIFIFEASEQAVGMFKLIRQPYRNHHVAYLGGLGIHPDFSGKGYGQQMMTEILALGKQWAYCALNLLWQPSTKKLLRCMKKMAL